MDRNEIEDLLINGDLRKAIDGILDMIAEYRLERYRQEAIIYKSRVIELLNAQRIQIEDPERISRELHRLSKSMLELLDILEQSIPSAAAGQKDGDRVFISYAWEDESEIIVREFEQAAEKAEINVVRDKINGVGYKGNIEEFELQLSKADFILLVLSDKYLKSDHCMFELLKIKSNKDMDKAVYPIVMNLPLLRDQKGQLLYYSFWETKWNEQNQLMKNMDDLSAMDDAFNTLKLYRQIKDTINALITYFIKINTLTPDIHRQEHFQTLIGKIKENYRPAK
jgi:hypothetical protein